MGQAEIMQFLNEHKPQKFTAKQISESLNIHNNNAYSSLAALKRFKLVEYNFVKRNGNTMHQDTIYWVK